MKPNGGGKVPPKIEEKIKKDFGSFEKFREEFINAGVTQFGSGWCWLSIKEGKLVSEIEIFLDEKGFFKDYIAKGKVKNLHAEFLIILILQKQT